MYRMSAQYHDFSTERKMIVQNNLIPYQPLHKHTCSTDLNENIVTFSADGGAEGNRGTSVPGQAVPDRCSDCAHHEDEENSES